MFFDLSQKNYATHQTLTFDLKHIFFCLRGLVSGSIKTKSWIRIQIQIKWHASASLLWTIFEPRPRNICRPVLGVTILPVGVVLPGEQPRGVPREGQLLRVRLQRHQQIVINIVFSRTGHAAFLPRPHVIRKGCQVQYLSDISIFHSLLPLKPVLGQSPLIAF